MGKQQKGWNPFLAAPAQLQFATHFTSKMACSFADLDYIMVTEISVCLLVQFYGITFSLTALMIIYYFFIAFNFTFDIAICCFGKLILKRGL